MAMLMLTGEYEHTIDEKNRLFISNKLRSQIDTSDTAAIFTWPWVPTAF
jgi:DNA-binding transcriptional regulator/RsmH inhibitor MraZ